MKLTLLTGIVLIILGVAAVAYHVITYTARPKGLQWGLVEPAKKAETTIPLLPVLGGGAIAAGCLWMLIGTEKT